MHAVALRGQLLALLSLGEVRIVLQLSLSVAAALHYSVRDFSLIIVIIMIIRRVGGVAKVGVSNLCVATCQRLHWSCHITSSLQAIFSSPSRSPSLLQDAALLSCECGACHKKCGGAEMQSIELSSGSGSSAFSGGR